MQNKYYLNIIQISKYLYFNKEYVYYKSDKVNFRVGLSYCSEFESDDFEDIHKNTVLGIDYSKEIVQKNRN